MRVRWAESGRLRRMIFSLSISLYFHEDAESVLSIMSATASRSRICKSAILIYLLGAAARQMMGP